MEMLERLRLRLGSDAPTLRDALDDALELAQGYCNLAEVPPAMEHIVVSMAAELWRGVGYGVEAAPVLVSAVSRGDVATSFAVKGAAALGAAPMEVLARYREVLNGFRGLRK